MPAKVILKVISGKLKGKDFVYDERTTCIIGRAVDCNLRVPDDEDHRLISRHHCLLDINPPGIIVRDMGSLNGTYVNGKKIGQRERSQSPNDAGLSNFPEYELKEGDEIKLGKTVFKTVIYRPAICVDCSTEIEEDMQEQALIGEGLYRCPVCASRDITQPYSRPPDFAAVHCSSCGKDVTVEAGPDRHGDYICAECRANPIQIVQALIEDQAKEGNTDTLSIKGYTIIRELGKGGMGAVYLAKDNATGMQVALKMMLSEVAVNERSREMFLREVENTKHLKHPNVVQLLDYGSSKGTFYFTLEYCDGGGLDRLVVERGGRVPLAEAGPLMLPAFEGLDYAHKVEIPNVKLTDGRVITAKGLVHRDIKPSNLFLSGSGSEKTVKIADFGLGKAFDAAGMSGYTRTGVAAGTPVFMPRQQVINFKYSKPEIDVWSLVATFYYILTGRFPRDFPKGKDPWSVVLQTRPVPIKKRDSKIPDKVAELIDSALIDQPEIAFKNAADFKRELEKVL